MTSPSRPRRERKGDRLLCPGATAQEIAVDHAIAPFDRAVLDAERVWGIERLPALVSPEMAAKYGAAVAFLNDRINAADPEGAAAAAANCIRGLAAMDAEARAAGHAPVPPEAWPIEVAGKRGFLIRDAALWPVLAQIHPGATIWTLTEVTAALAGLGGLVADVKAQFDGAAVSAIRKPETQLEKSLDDFIPF